MNDELIYSQEDVEEYLAHHGILGMKWGQQNGPPYPLDSKVSTGKRLKEGAAAVKKKLHDHNVKVKRKKALKKAQETKAKKAAEQKAIEAKKKQVADSHDINQLYENMKLFDDKELKALYDRLNQEQSVRELYNKNHKTDAEKVLDFLSKAATASTSVSTLAKNYDEIAKVLGVKVEKKNDKKQNDAKEKSKADTLKEKTELIRSQMAYDKAVSDQKAAEKKAAEKKAEEKKAKRQEKKESKDDNAGAKAFYEYYKSHYANNGHSDSEREEIFKEYRDVTNMPVTQLLTKYDYPLLEDKKRR